MGYKEDLECDACGDDNCDACCEAETMHWCHGCGDEIPNGHEIWINGEAYCQGCNNAPQESEV